MSVLSSAQVTLAWSAGILATVRYYQLAAPTAATPTVPTSSSDIGSWSETEPTADVTKVLWTCERTVYADGTESWSKASKSTSYEAAKDAKSTAAGAAETASRAISRMAMATCDTAQDVAAKVATVASGEFTLATGACVQVVFSAANVALSPTLDVGGTGAKPIMTNGTPYAYWVAGSAVSLVYDGSSWQVCSTPVYASTVTVGNPGGANVYLNDNSVSLRNGRLDFAKFDRNGVLLSDSIETTEAQSDGTKIARKNSFVFRNEYKTNQAGEEYCAGSLISSMAFNPFYIGSRGELYGYNDVPTISKLERDGAYIRFSRMGGESSVLVNADNLMLKTKRIYLNGYLTPTVLFYNESQAINTSIPLSYSAGDYTRLKIFYKSDDSDYCSVEVYNPDGKTVALQIARPAYAYAKGAAPVMYLKSKIVKISGATIDTVRVSTYGGGSNYLRMQKNLSSSGYEVADKVGIIRVEGYKW